MDPNRPLADSTLSVHGSGRTLGPLSPPIVRSSTFAHPSTKDLEEVYEGRVRGYVYSRYSNPTVEEVEEHLARLEGGEGAVLTASGMGSAFLAVLSLVQRGEAIVASEELYGGTSALFERVLPRLGIRVVRVPATEPGAFERALLEEKARIVWVETPTNPTLRIVDLRKVSDLAHARGALLVVDSTFATPVNSRPLRIGADVVMHSATKFLGGHSDLLGGVLVASGEVLRKIRENSILLGATPDPEMAFLLERGVRTLALRVRKSNENALALARFLENHPRIRCVHYPGLESHPQHALARAQMPGGFGGVLSFDLDPPTRECSSAFVDSLRWIRNAASLGGVESLASIPVVQSHRGAPPEVLERAGITPGTVRISAGIEETEDLLEDVSQALEKLPER